MKTKKHCRDGIPGLVIQYHPGTLDGTVRVYDAEQCRLTETRKAVGQTWPYFMTCEAHGTACGAGTLDMAKWSAQRPHRWCPECKAIFTERWKATRRDELLAAVFYASTGVLAPGKDNLKLTRATEERRRYVWEEWLKQNKTLNEAWLKRIEAEDEARDEEGTI